MCYVYSGEILSINYWAERDHFTRKWSERKQPWHPGQAGASPLPHHMRQQHPRQAQILHPVPGTWRAQVLLSLPLWHLIQPHSLTQFPYLQTRALAELFFKFICMCLFVDWCLLHYLNSGLMHQSPRISLGASNEGRESVTHFAFHKIFDSPSEISP